MQKDSAVKTNKNGYDREWDSVNNSWKQLQEGGAFLCCFSLKNVICNRQVRKFCVCRKYYNTDCTN